MKPPLLELDRVGLRVTEHLTIRDVSLTVDGGESVGLVVPRARTTLLFVAAGLRPADEGRVLLDGIPIDRAYRDLAHEATTGFVFQNGGLLENTSVADNVALPLRYHTDLDEDEINRRVTDVLEEVGLGSDANRFPYQLPRGAQRLASLARALAVEPALVYVDDLHHGATVDIWERFVAVMDRARARWNTAFLSGLATGFQVPPGVDRLVFTNAAS
jgi:phospholipid/cholesterol/gamma-HCH transport system ATP-binding protein